MKNGLTNIRLDKGVDSTSDKKMTGRSEVVGTMAPQTPLYASDPNFKASVDTFVQAGVDLALANTNVEKAKAELVKALSGRAVKRNQWKKAHSACAVAVQNNSGTPEDAQACGFPVLEVSNVGILLPTSVDLRFDSNANAISVYVRYSKKGRRCLIEASLTPDVPGSFKQVEGDGVRRTLLGFAPGTWWFRVATTRAKKQSDWFGPVAVVVK